MALPKVAIARDQVEIGGQTVDFRALTRAEALKVGTAYKDDPDSAESFILACGVDCTIEEARTWRNSTPMSEAGKLIDGIIVLSGLATPEQVKEAAAKDDPKAFKNGMKDSSLKEIATL